MRHSPCGAVLLLAAVGTIAGCKELERAVRPPSTETSHPVDFAEALHYAELCNATYLPPNALTERFAAGSLRVEELPLSEVRYLIVFDDAKRTQTIAIRGTDNLANLKVDADFTPFPVEQLGIHLHQGFAGAAQQLHASVRPQLKPGYATAITGHSLGGALACILGMYLKEDGIAVTRIVTFGQPKVTNVDGAGRYAELPLLRFVNGRDPVADVPPVTALEDSHRFTHLGPEVILLRDEAYTYTEAGQAVTTGLLNFWTNLGDHEVAEHKIEAYIEALRAKKEPLEVPFEDREQYF